MESKHDLRTRAGKAIPTWDRPETEEEADERRHEIDKKVNETYQRIPDGKVRDTLVAKLYAEKRRILGAFPKDWL